MILSSISRGSGPNITFIHGFTQTKESWIPVIDVLPQDHTFHLLDAPGHGSSINGKRSLQEAGNDVADTMPTGVLVGYSMGARIALHTALQHPEKVEALILVSGTAGIEFADERTIRKASDEALALRISELGIPSFIDEWLSNPMFKGLSRELANIPSRCTNTPQGLGDSLRYAGTGTQEPLWDQLRNLTMPVLLVSGDEDQKFTAIATRMNSLIPNCEHHIMRNVGHTCHLEDVTTFATLLHAWLLRVQGNR